MSAFLPQGRENFSSEHISLFSFSSSSSFRLHPFSFSLRWTWGVLLREEGCVCLLQGKKGVRCCSVRVYALFPNPFWLRECGIRQVSLFGRLLAPNFCLKKMNTKQFNAHQKYPTVKKRGEFRPHLMLTHIWRFPSTTVCPTCVNMSDHSSVQGLKDWLLKRGGGSDTPFGVNETFGRI